MRRPPRTIPIEPMDLYDLHRPTLRLNVPSFKGLDQLR